MENEVAEVFTRSRLVDIFSRTSAPHATETFASIPGPRLWSCWPLQSLQPFAAYVRLDKYKALVEDVPIRITASFQSWRQRKLNPPRLHTMAFTVAALPAVTVLAVIIHIFHLAVVKAVAPKLVGLPAGKCDKAVVSQLPLHLQVKGD